MVIRIADYKNEVIVLSHLQGKIKLAIKFVKANIFTYPPPKI